MATSLPGSAMTPPGTSPRAISLRSPPSAPPTGPPRPASLPLRCWWSAAAAGQVASRQARAAPVVLPAAWQIPAGAVARAAKATESAAMAVPALSCCPSAARPTPTPGAPGYGGSQMLTTSGGNFTAGQEGYLGFRLNGTNYGSMRVVLTLEPTSTRSALAAR